MKHSLKPYDPKQIICCKDTGEQVSGDRYLSSKHWQQLRTAVFTKYGGECQKCHSTIPLEKAHIHHITYKRMGHENMTDLILYCSNCHTNVHNAKRRAKTTNKNIRTYINMLDDAGKQDVINYIRAKYNIE